MGQKSAIPDSQDVEIATRRVEAAIYAFGGYIKPKQQQQHQQQQKQELVKSSRHDSIFRLKNNNSNDRLQQPTKRQLPTSRGDMYEESFHQRYLVSANHISWEVEENPPVETRDSSSKQHYRSDGTMVTQRTSGTNDNNDQSNGLTSSTSSGGSSVVAISENQQKMKYR